MRPPFSLMLPSTFSTPSSNTRASRLESWRGFCLLVALCVAARAPGDGGRGGGLMACATSNGMVGTVAVELMGSVKRLQLASTPRVVLWLNSLP